MEEVTPVEGTSTEIKDPAAVLAALERAKADAKKFREEKEALETQIEDYKNKTSQVNSKLLNEKITKYLLDKGIPCAIYYPIPLHSQKAYADTRYKEEDFPVTNQLVKEVISLPMHTELDDEQIQFITQSILEFLNK